MLLDGVMLLTNAEIVLKVLIRRFNFGGASLPQVASRIVLPWHWIISVSNLSVAKRNLRLKYFAADRFEFLSGRWAQSHVFRVVR